MANIVQGFRAEALLKPSSVLSNCVAQRRSGGQEADMAPSFDFPSGGVAGGSTSGGWCREEDPQ